MKLYVGCDIVDGLPTATSMFGYVWPVCLYLYIADISHNKCAGLAKMQSGLYTSYSLQLVQKALLVSLTSVTTYREGDASIIILPLQPLVHSSTQLLSSSIVASARI